MILGPLDDDTGEGPGAACDLTFGLAGASACCGSVGSGVGLSRKFWPGSPRFMLPRSSR